jgi:hypothetical protein
MGMITSHRATTGLVERYIGTAYDNVEKVAREIESVKEVADLIAGDVDFHLLAQVLQNLGDSVADLAALAQADLIQISNDLAKGNYLGNRKIDIDLALNNASDTTEVTYQGATITTNEGVVVQIDFTTTDSAGNTVVQELASYTAIYNAIVDGIEEYNANEPNPQLHIVDTEIDIINSTLPDLPTMIRIRDTDGGASSIDRIQLQVYSGNAIEQNPAYYWARTTSALQTLANRIGDVIALGNDIDAIIAIATQRDEVEYLYNKRFELFENANSLSNQISKLITLHDNIATLLAVENKLASVDLVASNMDAIDAVVANMAEIQAADDNAATATYNANQALNFRNEAETFSQAADQASQTAAGHSTAAAASAQTAADKLNQIRSITVGSTITGAPGSNASVIYNSQDNKFTFVVPQGVKGDKGDAFTVNATGTLAERALYDDQVKGFSFLDLTNSLIYFKQSATSGDWSTGASFGKGDKGDQGEQGVGITSTTFTSTTDASGQPAQPGATDTYTITYSDGSTDTFTVRNGNEIQISDLVNDSDITVDKTWSSNKINTAINSVATNAASSYARLLNKTVASASKTLAPQEACFFTGGTTATLPANPAVNTEVEITVGNLSTLVVARNGQLIMGLAEDMTLDIPYFSLRLRYVNASLGWRIVS